ncbi:PTS sugar transporter subunit IIA [Pleionea sp. CnH1-48]|uniref:PTS sugar transporter subunit IIA n=1 Tax=Pleionea sp. CnH1-48 TaxID=2954494 RepID=UPI00209701F2|nr:PTS sugar transporter subunit IIA [Pleionea sp. CnH1-48]MCO7224035.1 PTS sugar transporter subunit IIA [Pleionea sp. CnH1-48]
MDVLSCLSPERTLAGVSASSKKRVFEILSQAIAGACSEISEQDVLESLFARERIGCTGLGQGIALPHGRASCCDNIIGALLLLEDPISYDSSDGQPVDIVFALLVPEKAHDDHISCLSSIAKLLRQPGITNQIRNAYSNQALFDIVSTASKKSAAE